MMFNAAPQTDAQAAGDAEAVAPFLLEHDFFRVFFMG